MIAAAAIALGAGAALAIQAALNGETARNAGLLPTAAGSLLIGALLLAALAAAGRAAPTVGPSTAFAGALGALYVGGTMIAVQRLGATATTGAVVGSQVLIGLILDRLGAFGLARQEITAPRLVGAALVIGGLSVLLSGRP